MWTLRRRTVLSGAAASAAAIGAGLRPGSADARARPQRRDRDRPNFVVILADDLGFADIGAYGSEIETPNLDALAAGGTTFTGATNNARCCPTRASILTGLYPTQTGVGYMAKDEGVPEYQGRLNDTCHTFGELLRDAGYRTSLFGKWHLGTWQNGVTPAARGFDVSYGPQGGKSSYFRPKLYDGPDLIGTPTEPDYYLTDELSERAADTITTFAASGDPFLTYVSYTAPHWPLH
ncbi:MAG: sulfatase-like hydrolase/transferase, partial [Nocardioidaceae bacterium]